MKKELDEMLVRYLQLCEAFRDSDIWSDEAKQAIELFNHGDKIIRKQCPAMLLYKSLCDASKLLEKIIKEECINDSTCKEICACANNVCNGLDCDYSVRDILTHNKPIKINMWITEYLNDHFELEEATVINRDYLRKITDCVIDELS